MTIRAKAAARKSAPKNRATALSPARKAAFNVLLAVERGHSHSDDLLRGRAVNALSATDRNPTVAAEIANAYPEAYIAVRSAADRSALDQAQQLVQREIDAIPSQQRLSAYAQALQSRSEQIKILAALQTGNAQVADSAAVPTSPSSPRPVRAAVIGLLLGLVVGSLLAVLVERADRRIRTIAEAEDLYDTPLIGVIPQHPSLGAGLSSDQKVSEAFRMVRARMRYYNVDREMRIVLVTSAEVGEGKSTVAVNLAAIAAEGSAKRVLLIDADLRRPSVGRTVASRTRTGLSELLTEPDQDLATAVADLVVQPYADDDGTFDVLLAGAIPPNPAELLESQRMFDLLRYVATAYDMVILDTAPVSVVSDAIPLIPQADGVIVVVRLKKSRRDLSRRLAPQLRALHAHVLGLVANGVAAGGASDYYGYGTGYYSNVATTNSRGAAVFDNSHVTATPHASTSLDSPSGSDGGTPPGD